LSGDITNAFNNTMEKVVDKNSLSSDRVEIVYCCFVSSVVLVIVRFLKQTIDILNLFYGGFNIYAEFYFVGCGISDILMDISGKKRRTPRIFYNVRWSIMRRYITERFNI
jgi:hypothetical protein